MLVACIGGLSMALPASAPDISASALGTLVKPNTQLTVKQLQASAQAITVKVLSTDDLGTGFLIKKQGKVYTVLTNAHVLRAGDPPYRLQTSDGYLYSAKLLKDSQSQGTDLALLQFLSPRVSYPVASFGSSFTLAVGQNVFAAGFAITDSQSQPSLGRFKFTPGQVSLVLDKALEGGYQVGYTNNIENGMSGGPLLNLQGEVVGVNGKHAYPLWDTPSVFQDGSLACPPLHQLITRLSFAVPIETVVQLTSPYLQLNYRLNPPISGISQTQEVSDMIRKSLIPDEKLHLQEQASAKSCTKLLVK